MTNLVISSFLIGTLIACFSAVAAELQAIPSDGIAEAEVVQIQEPQITPPPQQIIELEMEKRQYAYSDLIGYYSSSDYWYSVTCPAGETYATYSTLGGCCTEGEQFCTYATGCNGKQVMYINSGTAECGPGLACDTVTIFNSRGVGGTGVQSVIRCLSTTGFNEWPRTYYRNTFPLTTSTPRATATAETKTQVITATASPDSAESIRGERFGVEALWFSLIPVAIITLFGGILL